MQETARPLDSFGSSSTEGIAAAFSFRWFKTRPDW